MMKKQFLLSAIAVLFSISSLLAQTNGQRQSPEERTKATIEKLTALKLNDDQVVKATPVFNEYYTASQKAMEELRASGNFDRDAMQAKRLELAKIRDAKLEVLFTPEQFKQWISEVEPSLRPQRQQRSN